jgi:hypothetical protein
MIAFAAVAAAMAMTSPAKSGLQAQVQSLTQPRMAMALLECRVQGDGGLNGCRVAAESPSQMGVGEAALAMASQVRIDPLGPDGKPRAGETVSVPVRIQINQKN